MINHTGEMTIMNINSRRREQNLTNDADRSCESHHSLSRTRRVKRSLSLFCVSINNTTIYSNEPVRVRPNPRPQKGVVRSGLVWFRKNKSNKNTIHESINTTPLSRNNPCTHHRSPARSINHNHSSSRYYLEPTPNPEASPK